LRRIIVRVHAELLHILQAGLQPEHAGNLAIEVTGVVTDDPSGFHAVKSNGVLFVGLAVETNVVEGSSSKIDGAGSHEIELRNLPSVDRELRHLPFADIGADR